MLCTTSTMDALAQEQLGGTGLLPIPDLPWRSLFAGRTWCCERNHFPQLPPVPSAHSTGDLKLQFLYQGALEDFLLPLVTVRSNDCNILCGYAVEPACSFLRL